MLNLTHILQLIKHSFNQRMLIKQTLLSLSYAEETVQVNLVN